MHVAAGVGVGCVGAGGDVLACRYGRWVSEETAVVSRLMLSTDYGVLTMRRYRTASVVGLARS